jgi:hypothetical protein
MNKFYSEGFNSAAVLGENYNNPYDWETEQYKYNQYEAGFESGVIDVENEARRDAHAAIWCDPIPMHEAP